MRINGLRGTPSKRAKGLRKGSHRVQEPFEKYETIDFNNELHLTKKINQFSSFFSAKCLLFNRRQSSAKFASKLDFPNKSIANTHLLTILVSNIKANVYLASTYSDFSYTYK